MGLSAVRPVGLGYLELVTNLLQRQRLADPVVGAWEAADLQWWYTRDPHETDDDAVVWLDHGIPVVAVVFTRWSQTRYGCDVLGDPGFAPAWDFVAERCAGLSGASMEMAVAPDDATSAGQALRLGFTEVIETYEVMWLEATNRARDAPVPDGYALLARPQQTGAHPMVERNGPHVETRLKDCSLYDPDLDLAVVADNGEVAGYAMFWADRRTDVGLVEPMRVEDAHAGRGLGRALLQAGLERLAGRGCLRLKVSHATENDIAGRLYRGAGFTSRCRDSVYRRGPHRQHGQRVS